LASPVRPPSWKDYDASVGNRPTDWQHRFDISRWTIHVASVEDRRVGGAVVIGNDQGIDLLRNCPDCALVWDVRVAPDVRGQGIGSALLRSVEDVARRDGARALRVETQQNNVPACRFYLRNGFQLEPAMAGAYPDLPDELQLLWRKPL
jgi:GNAT superfamily N-acetyltransferase